MPASQTIPYDRPLVDLIAGLDATGHVTHQSFKKKSVTLHHNAGILSHQGVLNVWKTRLASAHFDVDAAGAVAQYVRVNEYAWATGNTVGNEESISIEMCNSTLSPTWQVSETTWKSAARLSAWLFANVIHDRPSSTNLFRHSHWYSTSCAGPYVDAIWSQILAETQRQYDQLTNATPTPTGDGIDMADLNDIGNAQIFMGYEKNPDGTDNKSKPVYWPLWHVLGNIRAGNAETQNMLRGQKAAIDALGAQAGVDVQAVYDAAAKGAHEGVQDEITGASVSVNLTAGGAA